MLLIFSSLGDAAGMRKLADTAETQGRLNVAFPCLFLVGELDRCVDLLCSNGRIPEAAFFARTYAPHCIGRVVKLWRSELTKVSSDAAEALADPTEYPNMFPVRTFPTNVVVTLLLTF